MQITTIGIDLARLYFRFTPSMQLVRRLFERGAPRRSSPSCYKDTGHRLAEEAQDAFVSR